ncbi:hypothetical protein NG788_07755 [Aliarcobacter cryaerophilus]|uniref:hypothetical protein n=1 Tax=Aliarcobacter cryaerophilus TaxID=28198 RepID=UPI003DA423E9
MLILFLIFIFYYMSFVVLARNVTYEIFDLRELTISELFIRMITENNIGFFYRFFDGIYVFIFRMIGLREFLMIYNSPSPILSSTIFFFNNFFNFPFEHYANFNLSSMYGIDFEDQVLIEGYAFGYVFDKVGQLYISSSNYIMFMLLSVISGFIFILTELSILFLLRKSKIVNNLRIFLIFAISFFVVLSGGLYFKVILIILFLYLLLSIFRIITNNHE